jgi:hypothetical protein
MGEYLSPKSKRYKKLMEAFAAEVVKLQEDKKLNDKDKIK